MTSSSSRDDLGAGHGSCSWPRGLRSRARSCRKSAVEALDLGVQCIDEAPDPGSRSSSASCASVTVRRPPAAVLCGWLPRSRQAPLLISFQIIAIVEPSGPTVSRRTGRPVRKPLVCDDVRSRADECSARIPRSLCCYRRLRGQGSGCGPVVMTLCFTRPYERSHCLPECLALGECASGRAQGAERLSHGQGVFQSGC